jgi:hypothetical protein
LPFNFCIAETGAPDSLLAQLKADEAILHRALLTEFDSTFPNLLLGAAG